MRFRYGIFSLWLLWSVSIFGTPACRTDYALLPLDVSAAVTAFADYDPGLPPAKSGPPFTNEVRRIYDFLLNGSVAGEPVAQMPMATKTAVAKALLDSVVANYPGFENHGPIAVGDSLVLYGRYTLLLVIRPDGRVDVGVRDPVNGRPVRNQPRDPAEFADWIRKHAGQVQRGESIPGVLELTPLREYTTPK